MSTRQHGAHADTRCAIHLSETHLRVIGYLTIAGAALQLSDALNNLAETARADRLPISNETTVGIHRKPTVHPEAAIEDLLGLFTVFAEPAFRQVHESSTRFGVL